MANKENLPVPAYDYAKGIMDFGPKWHAILNKQTFGMDDVLKLKKGLLIFLTSGILPMSKGLLGQLTQVREAIKDLENWLLLDQRLRMSDLTELEEKVRRLTIQVENAQKDKERS